MLLKKGITENVTKDQAIVIAYDKANRGRKK